MKKFKFVLLILLLFCSCGSSVESENQSIFETKEIQKDTGDWTNKPKKPGDTSNSGG